MEVVIEGIRFRHLAGSLWRGEEGKFIRKLEVGGWVLMGKKNGCCQPEVIRSLEPAEIEQLRV